MNGRADCDVPAVASLVRCVVPQGQRGRGHDVLAGCWMRGAGKPRRRLTPIPRYAGSAAVVSSGIRNCEISLKLVLNNYARVDLLIVTDYGD